MMICLLRSINIAESLEAIPPGMFDVLGTVLEKVPERNNSRVYRAPATSRVGEAHALETLQTVDAPNGARTVFQGDEDSCVLVREADLNEPDPEHDDAIEECDTGPENEGLCDRAETVPR